MRLDGTILHIDQYYRTDDTERLMIHTEKSIYRYDHNAKRCVNISDGTYTGGTSNMWTSEVMNDLYICNNFTDEIKKWNMSTPFVSSLLNATNYRCKKMLKYGERLCLYCVKDLGTVYPQRVKWSVVANPEDWEGAGSGYNDLVGVMGSDFIVSAEKLGDYVIIYGERTIALQEYKGQVDEPFGFIGRVSGVGLAAPRALVNLGEEHIFLGWDNVYSYKGGRDVEPIGDHIKDELFSVIDPANIYKSMMVYREEIPEIRLYVQSINDTIPDTVFIYDTKTGSWVRGKQRCSGYGYYTQQTSITWDEMVGTWDEQTMKWDDKVLLALASLTLLGDDKGRICQISENVYADRDEVVDGYYETKDYVRSTAYKREVTNWMELNFEARGTEVSIAYSTDAGETWSTEKNITLSGEWDEYRWDIEVNTPMIRFRFRNDSKHGWFDLRQFEVGYLECSDRGV